MDTTVKSANAWLECYVCGNEVPPKWGSSFGGTSRDLVSGDEIVISLFICKSCEKGSEE